MQSGIWHGRWRCVCGCIRTGLTLGGLRGGGWLQIGFANGFHKGIIIDRKSVSKKEPTLE